MKKIWDNITKNNVIFVLLLGLCPALAMTQTFERSYLMGLCVFFVLILSNTIISLIRNLVPDLVKLPVFILIIGTLVTLMEIFLKNELPDLYKVLSIYLPLITVNCIILGRALEVASKEKIGPSFLDAVGVGLGFMLALIIIGTVREVLGSNTLTIMSLDGISSLTGYTLAIEDIIPGFTTINLMLKPAGAFLTLGLLIAFFNFVKMRRNKNV